MYFIDTSTSRDYQLDNWISHVVLSISSLISLEGFGSITMYMDFHNSCYDYYMVYYTATICPYRITPMPVYTPMCDRSELSAQKMLMPNYTPMTKSKPRIRVRRQNKLGPQNICLRLCAFDELVSALSKVLTARLMSSLQLPILMLLTDFRATTPVCVCSVVSAFMLMLYRYHYL